MAQSWYHRSGQPVWGSSDFRFGPPPTPGFQPLPNWGGYDFYRAHAATDDPYLFDHAWSRVREYGGAPGGMGVGLEEARLMHRRAYGANEINYMSPEEIGHAAAYEAYRTWIHNRSMYQHFHNDIERQREALTGLAVAEASRLLNFRPTGDQYARLTSTEAAAHTASYIFYQTRNEESRSRSRYRRSIDDPYTYDDDLLYPHARSRSRHRSMSRPRSLSRHRSYSNLGYTSGYTGGGYAGSGYAGSGYAGSGYAGSGYGGSAYGGSAYGGSSYSPPVTGAYPTPYAGFTGSYAGSVGSVPMGSTYGPVPLSAGSSYGGGVMMSPSYTAQYPVGYQGGLGVPMEYGRSRSASFSYSPQYSHYPQNVQYPQTYMPQAYPPGVASSSASLPGGGQLVIIQKPSKKRKHRRSRSPDDFDDRLSSRSSRR